MSEFYTTIPTFSEKGMISLQKKVGLMVSVVYCLLVFELYDDEWFRSVNDETFRNNRGSIHKGKSR